MRSSIEPNGNASGGGADGGKPDISNEVLIERVIIFVIGFLVCAAIQCVVVWIIRGSATVQVVQPPCPVCEEKPCPVCPRPGKCPDPPPCKCPPPQPCPSCNCPKLPEPDPPVPTSSYTCKYSYAALSDCLFKFPAKVTASFEVDYHGKIGMVEPSWKDKEMVDLECFKDDFLKKYVKCEVSGLETGRSAKFKLDVDLEEDVDVPEAEWWKYVNHIKGSLAPLAPSP